MDRKQKNVLNQTCTYFLRVLLCLLGIRQVTVLINSTVYSGLIYYFHFYPSSFLLGSSNLNIWYIKTFSKQETKFKLHFTYGQLFYSQVYECKCHIVPCIKNMSNVSRIYMSSFYILCNITLFNSLKFYPHIIYLNTNSINKSVKPRIVLYGQR